MEYSDTLESLIQLRDDARSVAIANFADNNPGVDWKTLPDSDFEEQIIKPTLGIFGVDNEAKLQEAYKADTEPTKKKIVIFAEAPPVESKYELVPNRQRSVKNPDKLPKELRTIYDSYQSKQKEAEEYSKANPDDTVGIEKLKHDAQNISRKFYQNPLNTTRRKQDFIIEANNVVDFYKDDPNVEVQVMPFYTDTESPEELIDAMKSANEIAIFGHNDKRKGIIGGYTHNQLAGMIQQAEGITDCYMGTCSLGTAIDEYKVDTGKTFHYRPGDSWLGFDKTAPKEGGMLGGMYSRNVDVLAGKVNRSKTPVQYKTQKFKTGGVVKAGGEPKPIKKSALEQDLLMRLLSLKNANLNWVDRGLYPENYPSIILDEDNNRATHMLSDTRDETGMGYVFPTIIQKGNGELEMLEPYDAYKYAMDTNTIMRIPSIALAEAYARNGLIDHENGGVPRKLIK